MDALLLPLPPVHAGPSVAAFSISNHKISECSLNLFIYLSRVTTICGYKQYMPSAAIPTQSNDDGRRSNFTSV